MINLRSEEEIDRIRKACRIVAVVLEGLKEDVKPGVKTSDLDKKAQEIIEKEGAVGAFKGYRGYPASICASINETVVHGIPSPKQILKEGDIVGLDVGVKYQDYYGDGAITLEVGAVSVDVDNLVKAAQKSLNVAITKAVIGNRVGDISNAIQEYTEKCGFSVVRDFVGHGIGRSLHEDPSIPNFGLKGTGPRLKKGMVLAIETMICAGTYEIKVLSDGWTAQTADHKPSAHFEHTIAVTQKGPEILTKI